MLSRWGKPPLEDLRENAALLERVAAEVNLAAEHQYYAGLAMKAMIEKWTGDPEKGRFVIAHKAHLIADAMVNADWEKKEVCSG